MAKQPVQSAHVNLLIMYCRILSSIFLDGPIVKLNGLRLSAAFKPGYDGATFLLQITETIHE